ncbi:hypothetical protein [Candidatus Thiosymbion oneisti]|uniref:hypothetical protein n=1 Tax=Candidatus Thiosymbion oneisti TaxID=589554 RepID=UPI001060331C|nr:hypothetical protein [Candidatus Thiosymbion oneisti]
MVKTIAAFGEDFAHQEVIGALIEWVATEQDMEVRMDWRNVRHGYGQVVRELKEYLRDLKRQGNLPDLLVVGTDANCRGLSERTRQIPVAESPVPAVLAIPDPYIERWLLLDGAAFKAALGHGCRAPDRKCARDRYKQALINAILEADITPSLGGIEFAEYIIQAMDLDRAASADPSLRRFLDSLCSALRSRGQ